MNNEKEKIDAGLPSWIKKLRDIYLQEIERKNQETKMEVLGV